MSKNFEECLEIIRVLKKNNVSFIFAVREEHGDMSVYVSGYSYKDAAKLFPKIFKKKKDFQHGESVYFKI